MVGFPLNKKYKFFVGVDVSRNELDFAVMEGDKFLLHKETENCAPDIVLFINELKSLPKFAITKTLFCMENTGIYSYHLLTYLKVIKAHIVVENALHIKQSLGIVRSKNDKLDSMRIARYASKFSRELRLLSVKRKVIQQLALLMSLRTRLMNVKKALNTPLNEMRAFSNQKISGICVGLSANSLKAINDDVEEIDKAIDLMIISDPHLTHLFKLVNSVNGIGRLTAIQMIISTNEFKDITSPKKFACYSGVAPFINESGARKGRSSISSYANKKMKALLHTCAMSVISKKGELRDYYLRKTTIDGKPKMATINAIRNKLILRAFACVNQNRLYQREYAKLSN